MKLNDVGVVRTDWGTAHFGSARPGRSETGRKGGRGNKLFLEALESRCLLSAVNVLQWSGGLTGNALNTNETVLTPSNVNSSQFGKIGSITLPGGTGDQIYAQPLYMQNVTITGQGTNNGLHTAIVILATEANNVYAYDANTLTRLWSLNVGAPIPSSDSTSTGGPNFNNFTIEDGITGTPVIDPATNTMYLDSIQVIGPNANHQYAHKIFAINITNGATTNSMTLGGPSNTFGGITPHVLGNLNDTTSNTGTIINFNAGTQLQRPGLQILNGNVYVAYGAYGNTDPYDGWVLGFNESSLALTSVFADTTNEIPGGPPSARGKGSIWQSGAELTTDGTYLYLVTGNGIFSSDPTINDYGESALKLLPDSNTSQTSATGFMTNGYGIHIADYFAPFNANILGPFQNKGDLDLGTSGALLLPDQPGPVPHEEILVSKEGVVYVLNRDNLGQYNSLNDNQIVQELSLNGHGMWGNPTYFNGNVYFHAQGEVVEEFSLVNGLLSPVPIANGSITIASEGATPVISANGISNGIVWEIDNTGVLRAYDATTLQEIYDSNQNASLADKLSPVSHFSLPTVDNGEVFVAGSVTLSVYGLKSNPFATPPGAPTALTISSNTGAQLTLNWNATASQNETAFLIERSANNTSNFTQIASVGIDVTSFADPTVAPGTPYFYRVRASNSSGNSSYSGIVSGTATVLSTVGNLYHMDAGGGTTVVDSSTFSVNNGTLAGAVTLPTWSPTGFLGGSGSALVFNGNNGSNTDSTPTPQGAVVALTNSVNGFLGASATLDFWINTTKTGNNEPTQAPAILGVTKLNPALQFPPTAVNSQDGGNDIRWGYIDASGHIGVSVDGFKLVSNPGDTYGVVSTTAINDGNWHNVALTRNATTGLLQVFIDGVLQSSFLGDPGTKNTAFNLIGAQIEEDSTGAVTGHRYFIGALDELHIYNQVLSPTEIAQLGSLPLTPTGLSANPLSSSSIQLNWTNASSAAQQIEIDHRIGTSGSFTPLTVVGGNTTTFTDTGLTNGTQYFYEIKAGNSVGTSSFTTPVSAIAASPHIVSRLVFYNNSGFDGINTAINAADDGAIATDKSALLPGNTATFANYTSYDKGLNGIMIDITGALSGFTSGGLTFSVGNDSSPGGAGWTTVTNETVAVRANAGVGGAQRIEVTFPDGSITGEWLQVTVLASQTGLAANDVFYFGNAIGETGNSASDAKVTATDAVLVLANATNSASVTNPYDINRDGVVNQADQNKVAANETSVFNALNLISLSLPAVLPASASPVVTTSNPSLPVVQLPVLVMPTVILGGGPLPFGSPPAVILPPTLTLPQDFSTPAWSLVIPANSRLHAFVPQKLLAPITRFHFASAPSPAWSPTLVMTNDSLWKMLGGQL